MKLLIDNRGKRFLVKDPEKDIHTQHGFFKSDDLQKKAGSRISTNKGVEMSLIEANFLDRLAKIRRGAQVIPLKDIGSIALETSINKDSRVIDAGAGSGYLALVFANLVKEVITLEIRDDHHDIVQMNIEFMGMKNIKLKKKDVYSGFGIKNADLVNLDLPEPWKAVAPSIEALKVGGYISSYSPTIPQVMDFVSEINKHPSLVHIKTFEIIERVWDVDDRKVRPKTQTIGHSGFITIVRRIG